MAVHYAQGLSADAVIAEIESLLDWRNQIVRRCFFPEADVSASARAPGGLLSLCREAGTGMDAAIVERLAAAHDDLCKAAQLVLDQCGSGKKPTLELYDAFENRFEGFVGHIRRLHRETSGSEGVDPVTGLRVAAGMQADLKREQDRFDRKGTSFSIAHIGIDRMDDLLKKLDRAGLDAVYAGAAKSIARTIRSFDDAYFLGNGEYLIILKHIDFMDSCAVMDRLRGEIGATPITLPDGDRVEITASLGVAEALQRESADIALQHAKNALRDAREGGGDRVQEYRETSALQKYARDMSDKGGFTS